MIFSINQGKILNLRGNSYWKLTRIFNSSPTSSKQAALGVPDPVLTSTTRNCHLQILNVSSWGNRISLLMISPPWAKQPSSYPREHSPLMRWLRRIKCTPGPSHFASESIFWGRHVLCSTGQVITWATSCLTLAKSKFRLRNWTKQLFINAASLWKKS